jgi:Mn2+/Fe2+ NRAMP family transporter
VPIDCQQNDFILSHGSIYPFCTILIDNPVRLYWFQTQRLRENILICEYVFGIVCVALFGERGTGQLLILSQVILSLQLSFAVVLLVRRISEKAKMGSLDDGCGVDYDSDDYRVHGYLPVQTFFPA